MSRTVTYFTGISASQTVFFSNEDERPSNLSNVKKVGQQVFPLTYHELDDDPDMLALWQFDGTLAGTGPEGSSFEVLGGASEKYGPGPVPGRQAFLGNADRSLRHTVNTSSLQLSSSVTYVCLYFPHEGSSPADDGGSQQGPFQVRGLNSSAALADNALINLSYGSGNPGIGVFIESGTDNTTYVPTPRQVFIQRSWNHIAVSLDSAGTTLKYYVNGTVIFNETILQPSDGTSARVRVLGPQTNDVGQARGYICSLAIIGRTLTDNEVFKLAKKTLGDSI